MDKISNLFSGVLDVDSVDINSSFNLRDNKFSFSNPSANARYILRTLGITADRQITLPLLTSDDTFLFNNFPATIQGKTISGLQNTLTNIPLTSVQGSLGETAGGTGKTTYTIGDLLYSNATNALAKLGIGSTGQILKVVGGVPAWSSATGDNLGNHLATQELDMNVYDVLMTQQTVPAVPASTKSKLFNVNRAGRSVLAYLDDTGILTYLTGDDTYRTARPWEIYPNGYTPNTLTARLPTYVSLLGSGSSLAHIGSDSNGARMRFTTANVDDADTGFYTPLKLSRRAHNPKFTIKFQLGQVTFTRFWLGLFSANPMAADIDAANQKVALRCSSAVGANQFGIKSADGTTDQSLVVLGSPDTNIHTIMIELDDTNSRFLYSWDGGNIVTNNLNPPASTTDLYLYVGMRRLTGASAAQTFDFWWLDGRSSV